MILIRSHNSMGGDCTKTTHHKLKKLAVFVSALFHIQLMVFLLGRPAGLAKHHEPAGERNSVTVILSLYFKCGFRFLDLSPLALRQRSDVNAELENKYLVTQSTK